MQHMIQLTVCVMCEVRVETDERVEHAAYDTTDRVCYV
jgi:hypothetical protein